MLEFVLKSAAKSSEATESFRFNQLHKFQLAMCDLNNECISQKLNLNKYSNFFLNANLIYTKDRKERKRKKETHQKVVNRLFGSKINKNRFVQLKSLKKSN